MRRLAGLLMLSAVMAVAGEEQNAPLTLGRALAMADANHPDLALAHAEEAAARARLDQARAENDLEVDLIGRLAWLEPASLSKFQQHDDSSLHLQVRKRLWDFGYSSAREAAAAAGVVGSRARRLDARQQRHLAVMKAFFEVLLADLEYEHENEAMSVAFVRLDKARARHRLGRLDEPTLARLETRYRKVLARRNAAQARQRRTRVKLALALGRPDWIPDELVAPPAPDFTAELPGLDQWLRKALARNPELKALQAEVSAAREALVAADRRYGPVLSAELGANAWRRETRSTHPFEAALVVELPLFTGGRDDAETAAARAALMEAEARLAQARYRLREEVTEVWLELGTLADQARTLTAEDRQRELELDRSRTLYDLEYTTDLGDAMVRTTAVRLARARVAYQYLLDRARLKALAGELIETSGAEP